MMLSEQISFGGRSVAGFGVGALGTTPASRLLTYEAGDTWELNFYADQPVSSQQFLSLVEEFQSEPVEVISFAPITEKHFRAIVKWRESGQALDMSDKEWEGVRYTVTAKPYSEATAPTIMYLPGTTWTINFESDKPVTPQQFFAFANEISQWVPAEVIGSVPIDPSHFAITIKPTQLIDPGAVIGQWLEVENIRFTATGAYGGAYRAPDAPVPVPAPTSREQRPCIPGTGILDPSTGKCVPCPIPSIVDLRTGICTPVPAAPAPVPTPTPALEKKEEKKKKISTAAIVVISVAVVAVGGGVVYAATRKKKKKLRRRAA